MAAGRVFKSSARPSFILAYLGLFSTLLTHYKPGKIETLACSSGVTTKACTDLHNTCHIGPLPKCNFINNNTKTTFKRKFLQGKTPYYANSSAVHSIKLIRAGDIGPNPGDVKNPCSVCTRPVAKSHRALHCSTCDQNCHIKCGSIPPAAFRTMASDVSLQWTCPTYIARRALPFSNIDNTELMEILQGGEHGVDANEVPAEVPILANTMKQFRGKKSETKHHCQSEHKQPAK